MTEHTRDRAVRVLLIGEGTYPFLKGGVATWCDMLVQDLADINFELMSIIGDPNLRPQYALPENVIGCRPVPIWGIREVQEIRRDTSLRQLWAARERTSEAVVSKDLAPHLWSLLESALLPGERAQVGAAIHGAYQFFCRYDFDTAMRSRAAWQCMLRVARELYPRAAAQSGYPDAACSLADVTDAMSLLYHWLMPLAEQLPAADVAHAVSAGLPSLIAIAGKLEHGMAFLLTEHGIYLRERYLAELDMPGSLFGKLFRLGFARSVTEASYLLADQISPGSNYNQRWEIHNGAMPERICTIYNGVDPQALTPAPPPTAAGPVAVWVGRITPIKDVVTLLRAAALVHRERPTVSFRLYGTPPAGNEAYYAHCVAIRDELGLQHVVTFGGFAPSAEAAFNEGDIALLSSISEGFPYSVIEAMLCARPVVATAVGGVPEALEGCGLTVEPRNPEQMARAIVRLADDAALRVELGRLARAKASQYFDLRQCSEGYRKTYRTLALQSAATAARSERAARPGLRSSLGPMVAADG